jgi:hypothetical protein
MIKFVSDLRQVGGFLRVLQFPPPIKLAHDIAEILLKVVLNTISLNISLKESICPLYLDNCYTFTLVDFVQ